MTKNVSTVLNALAFAGLFALCASFAAIRVMGLGTYIVTGGSMEPNIHKGSLVLVEPVDPSTVEIGDVITFQQYGQTTTHRVVTIGETLAGHVFKTKGDANTVADPEDKTFAGKVGVVRLAVPVIGYAAAGLQAYWRLLLTLLAAITFFGCAGALVFRRQPVAAPVAMRLTRVVAPVTVDADEAWDAHLAWLRSQRQRARVA